MDKCCHAVSGEEPNASLFDFRLFEDTYYVGEGIVNEVSSSHNKIVDL